MQELWSQNSNCELRAGHDRMMFSAVCGHRGSLNIRGDPTIYRGLTKPGKAGYLIRVSDDF